MAGCVAPPSFVKVMNVKSCNFTPPYGMYKNVKVKCTLAQALRPCTGHTAHRGSRGIALLFLYHGTRRG